MKYFFRCVGHIVVHALAAFIMRSQAVAQISAQANTLTADSDFVKNSALGLKGYNCLNITRSYAGSFIGSDNLKYQRARLKFHIKI